MWVAHEDGSLDSLESVASEGGSSTTAESVIHDLTTLYLFSNCRNGVVEGTYLGVSDEDKLGAGALLVVGVDGLDDSSGSLARRVVVADATASSLTTASRVDDSLRASSGVSGLDHVHKSTSSSIRLALRNGSLTGTEDVNLGAALPLSELHRAGGSKADDRKGGGSGELHIGCVFGGCLKASLGTCLYGCLVSCLGSD